MEEEKTRQVGTQRGRAELHTTRYEQGGVLPRAWRGGGEERRGENGENMIDGRVVSEFAV